MRLLLHHTEWASRSCEDCARWLYDEDGQVVRRPAKVGLPVVRPAGAPTPCHKCPKIPDSAPTKTRRHAVELSEQNWQAYQHYRECKATGSFPADSIVRRWAALILTVEEGHGRTYLAGRIDALTTTLTLATMAPRRK